MAGASHDAKLAVHRFVRMSVEVLNDNEEEIRFIEDAAAYSSPDLGINISGLESGG